VSGTNDLLDVKSHFAFGENWASFADTIGEQQIQGAIAGLHRLCGDRIQDRSFLDIGCGSGLHSLAALILGAREVVAVDLDLRSVETAHRLLEAHVGGKRWSVKQLSVFELSSGLGRQYDVVYSWGVLHHTGNLRRALREASALVGASGTFCFAVYRRTMLCPLWRREKQWYAKAGRSGQRMAQSIYVSLLKMRHALTGTSFDQCNRQYHRHTRGMDLKHDVHDWLGGFPYESMSPSEVHDLMESRGFTLDRQFVECGRRIGLFGSGCDEYVYSRV
jgi:2-polyprenyl-6-hydroxyphenyl methylase/3-demethylubiquinone-9 3-methyltransferase